MKAVKIEDQLTHGAHKWGFAQPLIYDAAMELRVRETAIRQLRSVISCMLSSEHISIAERAFLERALMSTDKFADEEYV